MPGRFIRVIIIIIIIIINIFRTIALIQRQDNLQNHDYDQVCGQQLEVQGFNQVNPRAVEPWGCVLDYDYAVQDYIGDDENGSDCVVHI